VVSVQERVSRPAVEDARPSGLLRANAAVAAGTLASRITGLVRVALLVSVLEATLTDSYNTANNVPNVVYELVLGGVLTATLVPLFTEQFLHRDDEATSAVVTISTMVLAALSVVATLLAPLIVRLYTFNTPASAGAATFRTVTTFFAYVFLPQIFFYGITALASALLNARRHFFAAAWAPVLNNVVVIVALLAIPVLVSETPRDILLADHNTTLRLVLAAGTTGGIAATAVALLPALRRAGVRLRWNPNWHHPAVRQVIALSGWTIGYVIANQVALYAMTVLAKPGSGGVTSYQAAFVLFQMPVGLLAVSIMTTFGPDLARARVGRDRRMFLGRMSLGLRSLALVTMPAAAGLVALARPTVGVVLEHGFFEQSQADVTAGALAAFSFGMFALSAYLFILRGFYAHNDTRTPFVINVVENAVNIVVGLLLVNRYGVPGLAWSFTIGYGVAALLAFYVLTVKVRGVDVRGLAISLARIALSAIAAGEVAWLAGQAVGGDTGAGALARVVVGTIAGGATYIVLLWFLRVPEVGEVVRRFRRGIPPAGTNGQSGAT
jgi:putative peptidoglycan lipid II flippase